MTTYYGVIEGNVVKLPPGVVLPDGTNVAVQVADTIQSETNVEIDAENNVLQAMFEAGLISDSPHDRPSRSFSKPRPVPVQGIPLSQIVIEDRR